LIRSKLKGNRMLRLAVLGALCLTLAAATLPAVRPDRQSAVNVTVSAFTRFPVIGLGLSHTVQDDEFALALIRDPRFGGTVRNIVIECGNSLYQPLLDRYIAGKPVPLAQLQLVWRNTTQVFGPCNDPHHKELLDAVRELNRRAPKDHRIRVLAGDSPIDWRKVRTASDYRYFSLHRDDSFASVVETQVLAKHQNALLVIGGAHVFRHHGLQVSMPTVTEQLEHIHRHSTYVIISSSSQDQELDRRLASWPVPSIAVIYDTWLGLIDASAIAGDTLFRGKPVNPWPGLKLQDLGDAYLYLGPASSMRDEEGPPSADLVYMRELKRRSRFMQTMRVIPRPANKPLRP